MITIDQFSDVDLRVGIVISAEEIDGSDKLLKMSIDIGEDENRTILSGIKKYYSTEEIIGKHCVIVANLQPRKMMDFESNGMIVCTAYETENGENVEIVEPSQNAPVGTRLS